MARDVTGVSVPRVVLGWADVYAALHRFVATDVPWRVEVDLHCNSDFGANVTGGTVNLLTEGPAPTTEGGCDIDPIDTFPIDAFLNPTFRNFALVGAWQIGNEGSILRSTGVCSAFVGIGILVVRVGRFAGARPVPVYRRGGAVVSNSHYPMAGHLRRNLGFFANGVAAFARGDDAPG